MHELQTLARRYLVGLWRHRWIAIAVAWALCAAGWLGTTFIPNVYEADARLYVDTDQVLTPLLKGLALENTLSSQVEVLQRTLLSRPNLEKLVSKTDLELGIGSQADMERTVAALQRDIQLVSQTRNLFTITYRNTNAKLAYDVVQTILNIFIESESGTNRGDMENARLFLNQQIASYAQQLRDAERKRAEFRTKYLDLLPADASGTSKLEEARSAVRLLEGQLIDAKSRRTMLANELASTSASTRIETESGGGGGALSAADRKLREMQATLTDANPDVMRQKDLIDATSSRCGCSKPMPMWLRCNARCRMRRTSGTGWRRSPEPSPNCRRSSKILTVTMT
jgi:polysaccharide chain length determinant protein (PEP-CTERM system associated)